MVFSRREEFDSGGVGGYRVETNPSADATDDRKALPKGHPSAFVKLPADLGGDGPIDRETARDPGNQSGPTRRIPLLGCYSMAENFPCGAEDLCRVHLPLIARTPALSLRHCFRAIASRCNLRDYRIERGFLSCLREFTLGHHLDLCAWAGCGNRTTNKEIPK